MSVVNRNIVLNILGKGGSVLLSIVFVPIYLQYLGAEAYGLVGVFSTLQSVFMVADMGLSGTFTRETARLSVASNGALQMHDLCRTFEAIFAVIGLLIACVIAASSEVIVGHWINIDHLSTASVCNSIVFIGVAVGLQFPFFIYQGGMLGLQRQVQLNILLLSLGVARGIGAVMILAFIAPSIELFFFWQVAINVMQLVAGYFLVWNALPAILRRPCFDLNLITPLWRFAAGTAGTALTGVLLTQSDKIVLIKILPLENFGYYTLAGVLASIPSMIAMPFFNAVYPRLTQLVAAGNKKELIETYHRACQFLSVIVIPLGVVLAFFSKELIFLWTGNIGTADNTHLLSSVLLVGSTLMCLMIIPYSLQLAYAWTKLGLYLNLIAVITLIPSLFWVVSIFGALGACYIGVALYTGQMLVMIHCMHLRILKNEKISWYVDDVGKPLVGPLIVGMLGRVFVVDKMEPPIFILVLGSILFCAVFCSAMSAPLVRIALVNRFRSFLIAWHR